MRIEKPWMSDNEINMITSYLENSNVMLEWGSGGSTIYFPQFVKHYISIEHDMGWYNEIKPHVSNNVNYYHIGLDEPLSDPTQKNQILSYLNFVDLLGISKFDRILIDGRGRGWCAEKIIPYLKPTSLVFIHDYWNRPSYHIVEKWYDVVDFIKEGQSLVVLKLKTEYNAD